MPTTTTSAPQVSAIRPKVLFQKVETSFPDANITFSVSIHSSAIGGMTLLGSSILVSLAKLTGAQTFFEFGTYMGATSVLLASNAPPGAHVTTLDLPPAEIDLTAASGDTAALILQNDTETTITCAASLRKKARSISTARQSTSSPQLPACTWTAASSIHKRSN